MKSWDRSVLSRWRREKTPDGLNVLVAIDESCVHHYGMTWLPQWFDSPKARVTVASVIPADAGPEIKQAAWARVAACGAAVSQAREANVAVLSGEPVAALRQYATDHNVDVLILGTRGQGKTRDCMGSVASAFAKSPGMLVLYVNDGS